MKPGRTGLGTVFPTLYTPGRETVNYNPFTCLVNHGHHGFLYEGVRNSSIDPLV